MHLNYFFQYNEGTYLILIACQTFLCAKSRQISLEHVRIYLSTFKSTQKTYINYFLKTF